MMDRTAAIERFCSWYYWKGHWMYESLAEAHKTWDKYGIDSLPDCPRASYIETSDAHESYKARCKAEGNY